MYKKTTHDICVSVVPLFLSETSDHDESVYNWAYHVCINNTSKKTVRLTGRFWRIFDADGLCKELSGSGILGKELKLKPGESFEYASGTTLSSPSGIIQGMYYMETPEGQTLQIEIPPFSLDSPYQPLMLH